MVSCFVEEWFPAVHGDVVTNVSVQYFERFMFRLMFLVYLSQGLHVSFFYGARKIPPGQFPPGESPRSKSP